VVKWTPHVVALAPDTPCGCVVMPPSMCVWCMCVRVCCVTAAKLYLVDLAGSEKVRKTGASGILVRVRPVYEPLWWSCPRPSCCFGRD
jgi:hypothetical protein